MSKKIKALLSDTLSLAFHKADGQEFTWEEIIGVISLLTGIAVLYIAVT